MRKREIQRHLQYYLWCYLAILVVAVVLWTSVYGIIESPDANERLTVSYFGNDYDGEGLRLDIENNISNITSQKIKKISTHCVGQTESTVFGSMIQTDLYSSDIMVFEDWAITDELASMSFRPITSELEEQFSDLAPEYYLIDGVKCGIILNPQGENLNNFTKYYSGSGLLVAFFAPYSENLGGAYGTGGEDDRGAIELMRFLLEEAYGEEN